MGLGNNYGRNAFKTSRTSYVPPTTHIADPERKGHYITDTEMIHDQFAKAWEKVYCAHPKDSNVWNDFQSKFGEYIPKVAFEDKPYTAEDFIDQLKKMKDSVAGFDGWTRGAFRLLPTRAWSHRAEIENMAKEMGKLPDAYTHVPSPMLPKGHAVNPSQHRGITIFSMLHRLLYGVMWQRLKDWQESWIDDAQQGGRNKGEYIADAWDLQAQIEEANVGDQKIVGAMLDYGKLFDRFQPDLVRGILMESGCPPGIARQLHYLYTNLKRYIRVAGTYGAVVEQTNGVGQGCSMSIIVANLYVTTLFRFLKCKFPDIELGAFLDDRNFTARDIGQLVKVLEATAEFDATAGHKTNLTKSTIFGNSPVLRKELKSVSVNGQSTPVVTTEKMVGHQINAMRKRSVQHISSRSESAAIRARKVGGLAMTRKQKARLIQVAVIPAASVGTLWDIPSKKSLAALRAEVMNAIWGKGRKLRSAEMVMAVINNPTRTDPLAAIV